MKREPVCHIVGAGDFFSMDRPLKGDFVVAADGGLKYLKNLNIDADIVMGDFDSYGSLPAGENLIVLPCEKDDTDMAACAEEAIKCGYKNFVLYGAVGGRQEHTFANLQLIANLTQRGFKASIDAGENIYLSLTDGKVKFSALEGGFISVFAHSDKAFGVTIKDFKYETESVTLKNTVSLGVSNEFIGKEGTIEVKDGTLLIVYPKGAKAEYVD